MSTDPVARSDTLDAVLASNPAVVNLQRIVGQHKKVLHWLMFSLTLDLALSGVVAWFAYKADHAASVASSTATQYQIGCNASNDLRTAERSLWNFILSFPPPVNETPGARAVRLEQVRRFRAYVAKNFANRNCKDPAPKAVPFPSPAGVASPSPPAVTHPQSTTTRYVVVSPAVSSSSRPARSPTPSPSRSRPPPPSPSPTPTKICIPGVACVSGTLTPPTRREHQMTMTVAWAVQKPLGPQTEPEIQPEVLIVHTMVGYLQGTDTMFRRGGYDGTESTFGLGGPWDGTAYDGVLWEWQDMRRQADAQFAGNIYADSVECSDGGDPHRPFSSKQLATLVKLGTEFCHRTGRKPQLVNSSGPLGDGGLGYHELRSDWNTGGHVCPGPVREGQIRQIIIPKIRAALTGGTYTRPASHPAGAHLTVDGIMGTATVEVLQRVMHGDEKPADYLPIDGIFGPRTRSALQHHLALHGDLSGGATGVIDQSTVIGLRAYLVDRGFGELTGTVHGDGTWDRNLTRRLQEALNAGRF